MARWSGSKMRQLHIFHKGERPRQGPRDGERGQTLLLVLVFLMLSTMLIVPALNYVASALKSQQISSAKVKTDDAFDSAIQDAIWKIINEAAIEQVNADGSVAYDFELSMDRWGGYTIEIPTMAGSTWQTIRANNQVKIDAYLLPSDEDPLIYYWTPARLPDHPEPARCAPAKDGPQTYMYVTRLRMVQWDLRQWEFILPPGLTYTDMSAVCIGPESVSRISAESRIDLRNLKYERLKQPTGFESLTPGIWNEVLEMPASPVPGQFYLVKEWVGGQQKLTWYPGFSATGNETFLLVFEATGTPPWGIHSIVPIFKDAYSVIELAPTASISYAMYNIVMEIGGQTVSAVIAVSADDGIKLISYQIL